MTPSSAAGLAALGSQAGGFFKENDMEDLDDNDKEEMFDTLDILSDPHDSNMFGAREYIAYLFDLDDETAAAVLDEWRRIRS